MALDLARDLLGNRPLVQRVRAFLGDASEHVGQRRVFQQCAGGLGRAIGVQKVRRHVRRFKNVTVGRDQRMQARGNREALFRQADRRREQRGPGQVPGLLVRHLQRAQHPRRAHRAPADLRGGECHRLTVGLEEQARRRPGRRGFAAVIGVHLFAVPQQDERTAANPRRLRLHQGQHRLHGNRRIDGRAALAQHFAPCFGRQRVGRRRHMPLGMAGAQVGAIARTQLRRRWLLGQGCVAGQQGEGGGNR